jgi:hypothetical protein
MKNKKKKSLTEASAVASSIPGGYQERRGEERRGEERRGEERRGEERRGEERRGEERRGEERKGKEHTRNGSKPLAKFI